MIIRRVVLVCALVAGLAVAIAGCANSRSAAPVAPPETTLARLVTGYSTGPAMAALRAGRPTDRFLAEAAAHLARVAQADWPGRLQDDARSYERNLSGWIDALAYANPVDQAGVAAGYVAESDDALRHDLGLPLPPPPPPVGGPQQ